jgi:hypothetical protein
MNIMTQMAQMIGRHVFTELSVLDNQSPSLIENVLNSSSDHCYSVSYIPVDISTNLSSSPWK